MCYMGAEMGDEVEDIPTDQGQKDELITADLSHLHALDGRGRSKPFLVGGMIGGTEVRVLIDTRATLDFLHPRVAEHLHLELTPIRPFRVLVGNGAALLCNHISRQTKLTMQGTLFLVDLHILVHHGLDLILGMSWLESLGNVAADFVDKTLEFTKVDWKVFLKGIPPSPKQISLHSLALLTAYTTDHEFYEIMPVNMVDRNIGNDSSTQFPTDTPDLIRRVLEEYCVVFSTPRGMPPQR